MTDWLPTLLDGETPKYLALADALQRDITSGKLRSGDRLPPYRDLAGSLGISPGTVSKAYVEARQRGLVEGEVGRGTYVGELAGNESSANAATDRQEPAHEGTTALIDISINTPPMLSHNLVLAEAFASLAKQTELETHSRYLPYFPHSQHHEAAVAWIGKHGVAVADDEIVLTNGAQHAMTVAISSIAERGDVVFTDRLTYPGILALASHLELVLEPVEGDAEGMLPTSLDKAARRRLGKAVYLMPSLQNPTGTTMSSERRRAIAHVAERHGLFLVEDDIYGLLNPTGLAPIREIAPEITFYLTSMSKSVVPSLRVGFLVPPKRKGAEVNAAMRATGWTAAPLMVDVAAKLILDGTAQRLAEQNRQEALRRQQLAHEVLGIWLGGEPSACYHAWLGMPKAWETERFVASARNAGVIVTPTDGVRVGKADAGGVRLCLGAARTPHILETALRRLEAILQGEFKPAFVGLI
jgi:DNA-binding transcriptional MocR family regulator